VIRCDPRGSFIGRHDRCRQAIRMEGSLIEIYLAACGKNDIEGQRRLAELPAKLRVKIVGLGIDECGNAHMAGIAMQRPGADHNGVGDAAQKSHHKTIFLAAAAYFAATRAARNGK
jgi:hypothetical protein